MKKNILFTFCCACVPGCGQMYQGYMRRGMSLALWFFGLIFLASFAGLGVLGIFLPVIWAYAFFDTFNIRNLTPEQQAAFGDDFIPNSAWLRGNRFLSHLVEGGKATKATGIALLVVGAMVLYNTVFSRFLWYISDRIPFLYNIVDAIPPLLVAGVVIFVGVRLLQGKPISFGRNKDDDGYSPFNSGTPGGGFTPPPYNGPRPFENEGMGTYTPTAGDNGSNLYASPDENLVNREPAAAPVAPEATFEPAPEVPEPPTREVVLTLGDDVAVAAPAEEPAAEAAPEAPAAKPKAKAKPKAAPKRRPAAKKSDEEKKED